VDEFRAAALAAKADGRTLQTLFLNHRSAPFLAAGILVSAATILYLAVGAFSAEDVPYGFSNHQQVLGMTLLLIMVPAYLLLAWGVTTRRSRWLLQRLDSVMGTDYAQRVLTPLPVLLTGAGLGTLYAVLFNLPGGSFERILNEGPLMQALVAGMILVWVMAGIVISSRLYVAGLFRNAGRHMPLDPYEHSTLEPFARNGMGDVLMTMGTLVLTTVQSIDATLRYENYAFAMLVAVPAALALLFLPMSTVHGRLKQLKRQELTAISQLIKAASKNLNAEHAAQLETLLKRRDRIQDLATWPLNVSMVSRLLIYGVIPPAAWIGAALVERLVEDLLG
jgi:hypothetical protein